MGGKENESFGSSPQFKNRLRVVGLAYLIIGILFSFQNCGRISKTVSDTNGLTVTSLSGLGMRDQTVNVGDRVNLVASFQNIPLNSAFFWEKNGEFFGQTESNVNFIASASLSDAGTYSVQVLVSGVIIGQSAMRLTVIDSSGGSGGGDDVSQDNALLAPSFEQQPDDLSTTSGNYVSLVSFATGNPAPTYQWQKDGVDIPGATGAILYIQEAQDSDEGTYRVRATNSEGETYSQSAYLSVDDHTTSAEDCRIGKNNNRVLPRGYSYYGKCKGSCKGSIWVGTQTVYSCDMNGHLSLDTQECGDSESESLQCVL